MTRAANLTMDFWTPTFAGWGDNLDPSTMPWTTKYDYMVAHRYDVETKEFTLAWRDRFNTLDTSRWIVANGWSYANNSSTYFAKNVSVKNSKLVLTMDHKWRSQTPAPEANDQVFIYGNECKANHDQTMCGAELVDNELVMTLCGKG